MASAIETFRVGKQGKPELIPTGFDAVDDVIGGLDPKSCAILTSATGLGKSRAMLAAVLNSRVPVGVVSTEDPAPVLGSRLLARLSGVSSMALRRKDYSKAQEKRLLDAAKTKLENIHFGIEVAESIETVEDTISRLCDTGCRMIWVDYLQKIRGVGDDRRNEVNQVYTRIQRAVSRGNAAGMVVSQIRRLQDPEKPPQIYHLKESGDLENEARLILLGHRVYDQEFNPYVRFRVGKSTFGGDGIEWNMEQLPCGGLKETSKTVKEL
jgi:replicative DNA helicase